MSEVTKPLVALDLDDLIFPFIGLVVPFLNKTFSASVELHEVTTYNFEEIWGCERSQIVELMVDFFHEVLEPGGQQPLDGSVAAINTLAEHFRLAIVTSRADALHKVTIGWIEQYFPGRFDSVHLCNNYVLDDRASKRCKSDVCVDLGAVALVDDSLHNITMTAEKSIKGVLFGDFPWNQAAILPQGVKRVLTWEDVMDELMGDLVS